MMFLKYISTFTIVILYSFDSYAASALSHVGGAVVRKGEISTEIRTGYTKSKEGTRSDGRLRIRQHIDYGLSDSYAFRLITFQDKREGEHMQHQAVVAEQRFQFIERREHGWDAGIRLTYTHRSEDKTPHEAEIRFLAQAPIADGWSLRHNIFLEHDIGEHAQDGIMAELRTQLTKEFHISRSGIKHIRVGAALFNDFGRLSELSGIDSQSHQFGPMMHTRFENGAYAQLGYRAAVSDDRADHFITLAIGKIF